MRKYRSGMPWTPDAIRQAVSHHHWPPPTQWIADMLLGIADAWGGTIEENERRPKIICLCGSSRFIEQFAIMAWLLEKEGAIVLGLHYLPASYPGAAPDHQAEAEGVKDHFDELHKRKVDLADEVLVLNVGGYIGDSTRSEIEYAQAHGKRVRYLEPLAALAQEKPR